jgi:D-amino peptidase
VKVYLSVDMEGIAGVSHPDPTEHGHSRYPAAVELMIGETNAAIEGAFAGGAADVLVDDSHDQMDNLVPDRIHPEARAGHPFGTIAHTYSDAPVETRLDGRPTGEFGLNALALAAWGVPVGLVAGDDALASEVEAWLPWAERIVVKTATGGRSAASIHPNRAADLVRAGCRQPTGRCHRLSPPRGGRAILSRCRRHRLHRLARVPAHETSASSSGRCRPGQPIPSSMSPMCASDTRRCGGTSRRLRTGAAWLGPG